MNQKTSSFAKNAFASSSALNHEARFSALTHWLIEDHSWRDGVLTPLVGDASFRHYYRWQRDAERAMVMDAPPPQEDIRPFIQVQSIFTQLSVPVPEIYRHDVAHGFVLLEDFGDRLFAQEVSQAEQSQVDARYQQALTQLIDWQSHENCHHQMSHLPLYDAGRLIPEMHLFPEWLLSVHLASPLTKAEIGIWHTWQGQLLTSALAQPTTLVHRDYHSRNIMITEKGLGIIDFQDAVQGPLLYDAVSLLKDAYLIWPEEQVSEWLRSYFLQLVAHGLVSRSEWQAFVTAFDWMGLQRHLKVLGIFARLAHRDGKTRYLEDLPAVAQYVWQTSARYPALAGMASWLERRLSCYLAG